MDFTAECDPSGYMMDFDSAKVGKILNNLLSNAFKYTPDGGSVSVKATLKDRDLTIRIADSGQGISPEAKSISSNASIRASRATIKPEAESDCI